MNIREVLDTMKHFARNLALAGSVLLVVASAFAQQGSQAITIARSGLQPSREGPAENFTGSVRVDPLFAASDVSRASGAYVTFEPGARSAWHTHPRGQILIVTAGSGRIQSWGGPIEEIRPGDVVRIPPGVKHWHGASPNSAMTHIAIQEHVNGKTVDWLEKVAAEQYDGAFAAHGASGARAQPSAAQKLVGDITPKLAELTDNVLFGDVWERPGLSKRDRSLATVAALIALNRPDQLRSHLRLALTNGVKKEELIEAITHLAFYSGWPNAISAALVAKEVLQ
jgi:4-carboxymuconolactone decarboxylase